VGAFLQLFKELFLILTTGYIIFLFLYDYRKALIWYLSLFSFISAIGLSRVTYNEYALIPLMLLFVLVTKQVRIFRPNILYIVLFIYMIALTYTNGQAVVDTNSGGKYLFIILLIYSSHLFSNPNYALKIIFLIWVITLCIAISFLIYGDGIFNVSNISTDDRSILLQTGIEGAGENDLNYFSSGQAIGAIITLLFIIYHRFMLAELSVPIILKKILESEIFRIALFLILSIQIWFVFRSLSRGGILVFIAGVFSLVYLMKKKKYFLYGGLFLIAVYLILNQVGIIDLLLERIDGDSSVTSGRNVIFLGALGAVYNQGGILQILFGGGIDWPWYEYWASNFFGSKAFASTHNQWISLFMIFGILGLILFLIPFVKSIHHCLKNPNPINNFRIVLLSCVFTMFLSLEPLIYTPYVWFVLALAATYTPNLKKKSN